MKSMQEAKYTGLFPKRIAVGLAKTEPTPIPIMYKPVVSATSGTETSYVSATLVKPAARIGVMPPPTMQ
jgi:hypothetical protein